MTVIPMNQVDPDAIPESVKVKLCSGAVDLVRRRRSDPEYRARYEKWLAERKKSA
ncbi:MAG: hypothetical protein IJV40_02880 [Oscillospiraceae bacterium]|nr:hypothetical protein [Oscillospiraceae bacterium]